MDEAPLSFLGRTVGPAFDVRVVTVEPGGSREYDDAEWLDALVVVESGEIVLECRAGERRRFGCGEVLWLAGLPLRALHNLGPCRTVLVAVTRRKRSSKDSR